MSAVVAGREPGRPWWSTPGVESRVDGLVAQLTVEEKVALVTGDLNFDYGFYGAPVERVGIPALTMADGPAGVRISRKEVHGGRSTALPAPIALAASWDPSLARRYGEVLGSEAHASGHNVSLGPAVDIARVPVGGRTFESFGEDPLLQADIAVEVIRGVQSHPVEACVKHFFVNNQEEQRSVVDARVDERTMREIYLPPFRRAVQDGEVASVMASFNRVNGTYATENGALLTDLLRDDLGFAGWVMSDFGATHSTVESALAGLDQEQPSAGHWGEQLLAAVQADQVPLSELDDKVRRILRPMCGLGLIDEPAVVAPLQLDEHAVIAQAVAEQSMVLLKNTDGFLPLAPAALTSLAVIGPDVGSGATAGGGSSLVTSARSVSPLEGLRARLGEGVRIETADGADPVSAGAMLPGATPIPSAALTPSGQDTAHGLRGEYWTNPRFDGVPAYVRTDPQVDLNLGFFNFPDFNASSPRLQRHPLDLNGQISVRWTGTLATHLTGDYELVVTSLGSVRLFVDNELLVEAAADTFGDPDALVAAPTYPYGTTTLHSPELPPQVFRARIRLAAGQPRALRLEYAADTPAQGTNTGAQVRLGWTPPEGYQPAAAVAAAEVARGCDAAVVVVRSYESEALDRPDLRLPNGQDAMIEAVTAANPRTVVVIMSGAPVETGRWNPAPAAIVQAWYPGQEQGTALARVLCGDVDPAGRLPLTMPRDLDHTPITSPAQYPGVGGVATYSEGVLVGYRGYDAHDIEPDFPFGHGLSYTSFDYADVEVTATADPQFLAVVSFQVTNTGARDGTEVAQVYVGTLPTSVVTPPRQLAGFAKVVMRAGDRQRLTVPIRRQSVSFWDADTHAWATPSGHVQVYVGRSSRNLPLTATITLP